MFSPTGAFLGTFGSSGTGNGQFSSAVGIAIAANGTLYIADASADRVQLFTPTGTFISAFGSFGTATGQFSFPSGPAIASDGTVVVADRSNNRVQTFTAAGTFVNAFGSAGSSNGTFSQPNQVSIAPNGNLYITDSGNNRVQVFSSTGIFQTAFGSSGSGNGQLSFPAGISVAASGYTYVLDSANARVEVFSPTNVFQSTFGSAGAGNGQFNFPSGAASLVATPNGMVYVCDQNNNRVERLFDPNAWTSGTNTFTDVATGPTNIAVGGGQLLGTSLTLASSMNLNVGNTLAVLANGTLIQSGGNISVTGLLVSGRDTYQSGNLSVSNLTLNAGSVFQATQGGAIAVASTLTIVSVCTLDGNVSVSTATTALNSGGYLTLNNASLYATSMVLTSGSTLQLNNPVTSYIQAGTITNGGDIAGAGYLNVTIFNNAGGEIDVALAQSLTIAGAGNTNSGLITLVGGTLHFTHALTNSASIQGFGSLRVDGGLTNNGTLALAGSSAVYGNITNNATIHLQGTQPNVFFGNITNNSSISIDTGTSATFYGTVSGNAPVSHVVIAGQGSATLGLNAGIALSTADLSLAGSTNNWSSLLDVTTNAVIVETTALAKSAAIGTLRNQVAYGLSHPSAGIVSSALPANTALAVVDNAALTTPFTTFFGQPVDLNSLLVAPELLGDTDISGTVDLNDLNTVLNNLGTVSAAWTSGNFDGASTIDLNDLNDVLNHLGTTYASSSSVIAAEALLGVATPDAPIPEPATMSLFIGGAVVIGAKRRRR